MPIIAGIDEAGYGPTLGPLVVTSTIFNIPGSAKNNIWELLKEVTSDKICKSNDKIIVTDSKKVYSSSSGLQRLETTTLSFIYSLKGKIDSFKNLLISISKTNEENLDIYPWYAKKDIFMPVTSGYNDISNYVKKLSEEMKKRDVELIDITTVPITSYYFNEKVNKLGNKSVLLFNTCAKLILNIWNRFGEMSPTLFIDKHGGRNRYMHLLLPIFDNCFIRIHKEGNIESVYEVIGDNKNMMISFIQGSETKHFPIALSSMCSKYIRELFIRLFNSYWQEKVPGIRPTAGYYQDAVRFLTQIAEAKCKLGISDDLMVRVK